MRLTLTYRTLLPAAACVAILIFTAFYFSPDLSTGRALQYDEFCSLERSYGFLKHNDWLSVYSYNEITAKKPPLQYWLNAILLKMDVPELLALRVWSLVFFLGLMAVSGLLAINLSNGNLWAGAAVMLLLACSREFIILGRSLMLDTGLAFFAVGALYALELTQRHAKAWLLCGIFLGLGYLQKAPVGLLYTALVIFILYKRGDHRYQWSQMRQSRWFNRGFYTFLVLLLAWPILQSVKFGSQYLSVAIKREMFNRFSPVGEERLEAGDFFKWLEWLWHDLHYIGVLGLIATIAVLLYPRWKNQSYLYALAWLAIAVAASFCLATGRIYSRYLVVLTPIMLIILVVIAADISRKWKPTVALLAVIATLFLKGHIDGAILEIHREDNYSEARHIVELVDAHRQEGDRVVIDGSTVPPGIYGIAGESRLPFYGYRAKNDRLKRFIERHGDKYSLIGITDQTNRAMIEAASEEIVPVAEVDGYFIWRYSPTNP